MATRLIKKIKQVVKRSTPEWVLLGYHASIAYAANLISGQPSKKMLVIGITGTKGKTSTANFLHGILTAGGYKTGLISTANLKIGEDEKMNPYHMTMPGRGLIHFLMKDIQKAGCQICIVEVTSEGLKQNRHLGILFDIAVFTNLTPEHLTSHNNSFEEYRKAKLKLFETVSERSPKSWNGQYQPRVIVANLDSSEYAFFTQFPVDKIISYGESSPAEVKGQVTKLSSLGLDFKINDHDFHSPIPGSFNLPNILAAVAVARTLNITDEQINKGLSETTVIAGRMEEIKNDFGFKVFVDYAHEKESMERVLKTGRELAGETGRVILLLGAEGGGRDKTKRAAMALLANDLASLSIITNVDPYTDDPEEIANDIYRSLTDKSKAEIILDRKTAIKTALNKARTGDVILITGKGAEQSIIIDGVSLPWDDRKVTRELLAEI